MMKSNAHIVIKGLKGLQDNGKDTKPLMQKIAADMESKIQHRFRLGKDPNGNPWKPLSETTKELRRKGSDKPLNDTGALALSMNYKFTKDMAVAGTNKVYAAFQNFGAKKGEFKKKEKETVKSHTRRAHTRETRLGTVRVGESTVKQHERTNNGSPWGNTPGREFMGFSENQKRTYGQWIKKHFKEGR